ncbi:MAG: O-antigen ligase [Xanthobacteraceae bacterium]
MANIGYLPRQDFAVQRTSPADILIRSVLIAAVFLSLWISFHPFPALDEPIEVTEAGNLANQLGYSTLFVLLLAWNLLHQPQRLLLLVRPVLIATLLWFALTVVTSWDPALSARRLAFALVTIGIAGMVLLVPKNPRHFADVMAVVVLIVLAACYLGVALAPQLTIHQASDVIEPELAGDWRGVFGHKNEASVVMVLFVFIGMFIARVRSLGLGAVIVMLALPFLFFTNSKTAMAALPLALIVSVIMARAAKPANGVGVALGLLLALNLLSIGSIYIAPIHALVEAIMPDATFTGRTDIWKFAIDHIAQRPITGYGFATFWGTEQVVYGMTGATWANTASHAHNGFVDLALTIGIPGSALMTLWLVVLPLFDYYRAPDEPESAALKMLFLRICLFAAFESCFETLFTQVGALWLILIAAAFGLRLVAVAPVSR